MAQNEIYEHLLSTLIEKSTSGKIDWVQTSRHAYLSVLGDHSIEIERTGETDYAITICTSDGSPIVRLTDDDLAIEDEIENTAWHLMRTLWRIANTSVTGAIPAVKNMLEYLEEY